MAKITVIGGGNMGSLLSAKFSINHEVTLYLNSPYEVVDHYSPNLCVVNELDETVCVGNIKHITDNLKEAVCEAEWIFITFPAFLFHSLSERLIPLLHEDQHLIGIPGSGGFEFYFKDALDKGCTLTGLQRVHSVARIIEPGKKVRESGVRGSLRSASIPSSFTSIASDFLSECYGLPVDNLYSYLNITLINSNPILHTSRLYSIFKEMPRCASVPELPLFYEEWDLESSELLVKMDAELFKMIDVLNDNDMQVDGITSLLEHYESHNPLEMTQKLNSIVSLKGLTTPSVQNADGSFVPDLKSRYFTADFPFGLDILLSFSSTLGIQCPNMLMVSDWYHDLIQSRERFSLADFSINNVSDLKEFYYS